MKSPLPSAALAFVCLTGVFTAHAASLQLDPAKLPAITNAMQKLIDSHEIAGAVTLVASPDKILSFEAVGQADIAAAAPLRKDSIFWIASMTKPITATAILMLQEEGKLSVDDPVAKYLPELANLKTADGKAGNLTLRHLLTHTSGMAEATSAESVKARTLADLIPCYAAKPLQFAPGSKWQYCQSGINSLGRIIEVVSGQSLPEFFQSRLFTPLGMKDTTFYPNEKQVSRIAKSYEFNNGSLKEVSLEWFLGHPVSFRDRYPAANGGLFTTASDYARFARMILNQGTLDRKRYLKPESVKLMTCIQTGDLKTGFTDGNGWGLGWCVIRQPQGITAMLSPGSFGHGGAYGTQAWIDPVKQVAYLLFVQRSNFPNSDASSVREAFQTAASAALVQP